MSKWLALTILTTVYSVTGKRAGYPHSFLLPPPYIGYNHSMWTLMVKTQPTFEFFVGRKKADDVLRAPPSSACETTSEEWAQRCCNDHVALPNSVYRFWLAETNFTRSTIMKDSFQPCRSTVGHIQFCFSRLYQGISRRVTAFLQTSLFLDWISREFRLPK